MATSPGTTEFVSKWLAADRPLRVNFAHYYDLHKIIVASLLAKICTTINTLSLASGVHLNHYTSNMANAVPPSGQPTPQQIAAMQQQMAIEAQKRGMTPQQYQQMQRQQLEADAKKAGLSFEQYINQLKQKAFENHQRQQQAALQQAQNGQQQQGQQVPINPGAPDPRALELAQWLRGQNLKTRTSILNGQRKDMFRGRFISVHCAGSYSGQPLRRFRY